MRKSLWIMLAVMVVAISAPNANADSITDGTFIFNVITGNPTPTGSFIWDSTTSTWISFTVDWNGAVFNFALTVPDLSALEPTEDWCASAPLNENPCVAPTNFLLNQTPPSAPYIASSPGPWKVPTDAATGTYTVTETVVGTPEPSSYALMLLGVGLVFLMRKRINHGLPTG
jgi:hypothetical protein